MEIFPNYMWDPNKAKQNKVKDNMWDVKTKQKNKYKTEADLIDSEIKLRERGQKNR